MQTMLVKSSCIFVCNDILSTEHFYVDKLKFRAVEYLNCSQIHICLYKDDIEIILIQSKKGKFKPNHILYNTGYDAYLYCKDPKQFYNLLIENNIEIVSDVNITDYNNKELVFKDCDGRYIAIGYKIDA